MKVLQVASSLFDWGGIERYIHYLDQGLTERGHSVVVVCPPKSPLAVRSKVAEGLYANRAQFSLKTYVAFRRIGAALQPDIAHIHFSPDFVMPALALRQTCQAKIVMTRHLALPWSSAKVRRYTKLFDRIIPVSHAVERKLVDSGVPARIMSVAKAGVPEPIGPLTVVKGEGPLSVGFFGRLVAEKGVDVLLKAIADSQGALASIYGQGPEKESLQSLANDLGISSRATFHGYVSDVEQAMGSVDVVAVPSVWDEAFPYSILEAMAVQRPVVASRVGGIPEVVEDGVTGRLFARGDAAELGLILDEMGSSRTKLADMGVRAREVQQKEYSVGRMAERIEGVYRITLE